MGLITSLIMGALVGWIAGKVMGAEKGLLQNIGPLVEYQNNEKPLSIAFREIDEGLLEETLGEDDANEGN